MAETERHPLADELTIGEAADRIGIATSALRFYEDRGLIQSRRTEGGQRRYARDVLRRVAFIRAAQSVGLSLTEIAEDLSRLPADKAPTKSDWARFGTQWQPRIEAQIRTLELLRDNLTSCIGCGCLSLDNCALFNPDDEAAAEGPEARQFRQS